MKLRIVNVVGARPNFMKMAPLMMEYRRQPDKFDPKLVHTGQHYDDNMSALFFEQLHLPKPDVYLGIGSGSHSEQTAKVMVEMEKLLSAEPPDLVVVVGDINSTMAATIAAAKLCIPVAHVEAGLRSFDRTMPEEINRLVTDALSDYCFITSQDADENLRREGVAPEKIFFVGNVMIDTLLQLKDVALKSDIAQKLGLNGQYGFVTLHRPSNVDDKEVFAEILAALDSIQNDLLLVFPVHPRTVNRLKQFGFWDGLQGRKNLKLTDPVGYLDSLCLMAKAKLVLTDSGGVQEETTVLGVPCLTIRNNTERPVTITEGTNTLVGTSQSRIVGEAKKILEGNGKQGRAPKFWDGKAAGRIVECLLKNPPKR
ncbi:MAG TPA: UDP-N-acetylglucosamine 2-epimerase (non-hydrolyzing) [Verrucomicrobiae bacterium]|nr:UDP-N-acetylglucosamine 2-epimerase (non-hydrolyzing) [Verrucomicrobiae bacterium]